MFKFFLIFTLSIVLYADNTLENEIRCEPSKIYKCTLKQCVDIPIADMGEVDYFDIYPKQMRLTGKINKTTFDHQKIVYIQNTQDNIVFFATDIDSPYNWTLDISKKDSSMLLSSSIKEISYTIFGTCRLKDSR